LSELFFFFFSMQRSKVDPPISLMSGSAISLKDVHL